jgi:hypothetical protein
MIAEHERIVLTTDVPEEGLLKGDVGTVVSVLKEGEAYTVEFMTIGGTTIAVTTLLASQVRPISKDEMQQARPLVTVP